MPVHVKVFVEEGKPPVTVYWKGEKRGLIEALKRGRNFKGLSTLWCVRLTSKLISMVDEEEKFTL